MLQLAAKGILRKQTLGRRPPTLETWLNNVDNNNQNLDK